MSEFFIDKYFIDLFSNLISDNLTQIVKIITFFGSEMWFAIFCVICLLLYKNKRQGILITVNLLSIAVIVHLIKVIVQRPRPSYNRLIDIGGYSFPSGHASVSMTFYGLLIYIISKSNINKPWKITFIILLSLLILLIGLSRVYLGVHYMTDVLTGFILGFIYLIIFIQLFKKSI